MMTIKRLTDSLGYTLQISNHGLRRPPFHTEAQWVFLNIAPR
jgi:hypothetical protein